MAFLHRTIEEIEQLDCYDDILSKDEIESLTVKRKTRDFKIQDEKLIEKIFDLIQDIPYIVNHYQEMLISTVDHFAPELANDFMTVAPLLFDGIASWGWEHIDHSPFADEPNPCLGKEHKTLFCLIMNDVFLRACSDSQKVPREKWKEVAKVYKQLGLWGLIAWAAKQRGQKPANYISQDDNYKKAVHDLENLIE